MAARRIGEAREARLRGLGQVRGERALGRPVELPRERHHEHHRAFGGRRLHRLVLDVELEVEGGHEVRSKEPPEGVGDARRIVPAFGFAEDEGV